MPRILGIDIPNRKRIEFALRYIFGIGPAKSLEVCERCKIKVGTQADQLTDAQIAAITKLLQEEIVVEGDLRRQLAMDIRRLKQIGSYRGRRHIHSLPCRGQRTKTNARTRKGKKSTVGAIRDKTQRKLAGK